MRPLPFRVRGRALHVGWGDGTEWAPGAFGCVTIVGVGTDDEALAPPVFVAAADFDFDAFFATHHGRMVRALALALGDDEFGRDAAAEGFARALQKWSTVATYANPAGWVYRVGLNWALSRRRRTRRERLGVQVDGEAVSAPPPNGQLSDALRSLSVEHRTVVVGRYYLDWSEAQLAEALDIAPGTVKSRLSRALTQLALLMEDGHGRS
jgi:RNA polymerase sigma-70 factor, ECF subfamily